jgi:hypothetical protein
MHDSLGEAEKYYLLLAFSQLSPLKSCLPNVYENRFNSNDKAVFETKANESRFTSKVELYQTGSKTRSNFLVL